MKEFEEQNEMIWWIIANNIYMTMEKNNIHVHVCQIYNCLFINFFLGIMMYSYQNADNTINVSMYRNLKSEKYTEFKKGFY